MSIPASYGSASSAGLPVDETSYLSAVSADYVEDLNTRLQEICRVQPQSARDWQEFNRLQEIARLQPSAPVEPPSQQQVAPCFPVMFIPVYPLHLVNVTPTMPTSSASPAVASPQKSAHSQHSKKPNHVPIKIHTKQTKGPSEKRQQREKDNHTNKVLTEEERIEKRQEAIKNMKALPMYYEHQKIARERRPESPNAFNRDFSKRGWEAAVGQWRSSLREIAGVSDLEVMGYSSKDSLDAWRKVEMRCKSKELSEQRQLEHKRQALSILLGEFA